MDEAIFHKLSQSRDLFLKFWFRHMHAAGFSQMVSSRLEDSGRAFDALMATLKHFATGPKTLQASPFNLHPQLPAQLLLEEARRHRTRGLPPNLFLACFKTMNYALADLVDSLEYPIEVKASFLAHLRKAFDRCEIDILTDWLQEEDDREKAALKEANRRLTREKNNYRIIFDATTNLVMMTDGTGAIVDANPQALACFSGRNIIGRHLEELLEPPLPSPQEMIERTESGGGTEACLYRDGFKQVFNVRLVPISKVLPENEGVLVLLNDITCLVDHRLALERTVTERTQSLADSEKMLRTLFESVGKGIALLDQDLKIVQANQRASEIYGISPEALLGTEFCSLTDAEGCAALQAARANLLEGHRRSIEVNSRYADGRSFPCQITLSRIDIGDRPLWPLVIWDISDFKALEERLRREKNQSEEMNVTLRNVLKTIESDRREFEQRLVTRIRAHILPALAKIEKETSPQVRASYLEMLREQLVSLTTGFDNAIDAGLLKLSKTELRICRFLQAGCSSKEICDAMNLAFETIQTHRKNIRRKLGLRGQDVNLHTYLANRHLGEN